MASSVLATKPAGLEDIRMLTAMSGLTAFDGHDRVRAAIGDHPNRLEIPSR